ncbi:energy transducer TonB [Rhodohalobacter sp. SW132]|nr:energy transducer TonB [Rhodohalobacter sp. SW132]
MVISIGIFSGCGSSGSFNSEDGFVPESELTVEELEALRSQVVDRDSVDTLPVVAGGRMGLLGGIDYPEKARNAGAEGTVIIDFIVDLEGNARDLVVRESVGHGLDEESIRMIKATRFNPARKNGEPVVVRHSMPIQFSLP